MEEAVQLIRDVVDKYNTVGISFNGGKDACVVLYLIVLALGEEYVSKNIYLIYFEADSDLVFPEMKEFVHDILCTYYKSSNKVLIYKEDRLDKQGSFKSGMQHAVDTYHIQAIFMGVRSSDPSCIQQNLGIVSPTNNGYPKFDRIHPILYWTYQDIWTFLKPKKYCILYDQGYTSLDNTINSVKNPLLKQTDGQYQPAYTLSSNEHERCGRL